MDPRLFAIWDRLARADEDFEKIERMLLAHYESHIGEIRGQFDPHPEPSLTVDDSAVGVPDARLHTITGEFLHNARSALDHLVWLLVKENGGEPTCNTTFPVLKVRPTANRKGIHPPPHIAGGVSAAATALIDAAQPYQWGSDYPQHPLWVLHDLWNMDKHRHIALRGLRMDGFRLPDTTPRFTFTLRVEAVSVDGAELIFVPDDPAVNVDARPTSQVFVRQPRGGEPMPMHATLKGIMRFVTPLVQQAEATCFQPFQSTPGHQAAPPTG